MHYEPYKANCEKCGDVYGLPLPSSNCKVSTSILNAKVSHMQEDWKGHDLTKVPGVNVEDWEVMMYPVGQKLTTPLDRGGAIFAPAALQALKCFYPFDGTTMTRPNRGCGCQSMIIDVCAPNKKWHCPTTLNTCSDRDPQSPFWKPHPINENSSVLSACQCTEMGITENDNPLFYGLYVPGTPKCVWSGPQYFEGKGRNELRQGLRQQYNFRKHALFPWSEAILDGEVYNNLFATKASETIAAFWYPRSKNCGESCQAGIRATRDLFTKKYGVELPIIVIDITNGTAPFMSAEQASQGDQEITMDSNPFGALYAVSDIIQKKVTMV